MNTESLVSELDDLINQILKVKQIIQEGEPMTNQALIDPSKVNYLLGVYGTHYNLRLPWSVDW